MLLKKLSDDRGLRAIITDLHSQHTGVLLHGIQNQKGAQNIGQYKTMNF